MAKSVQPEPPAADSLEVVDHVRMADDAIPKEVSPEPEWAPAEERAAVRK
jgi:hypothetical protein